MLNEDTIKACADVLLKMYLPGPDNMEPFSAFYREVLVGRHPDPPLIQSPDDIRRTEVIRRFTEAQSKRLFSAGVYDRVAQVLAARSVSVAKPKKAKATPAVNGHCTVEVGAGVLLPLEAALVEAIGTRKRANLAFAALLRNHSLTWEEIVKKIATKELSVSERTARQLIDLWSIREAPNPLHVAGFHLNAEGGVYSIAA